MSNREAKGFSPVIIILATVIILVVALIAGRVYESNKTTQQPDGQNEQTTNTQPSEQSETPEQQPATNPNEGYVVIKEWGVRFKPASGLSDFTYFRAATTPQSYDRYDLSTQELGNRDANCKAKGFASITRSMTEQGMYETLLAKIGNYYYYYRGSDSACSSTTANMTFEAQQRNLTKESVKSLEAAK